MDITIISCFPLPFPTKIFLHFGGVLPLPLLDFRRGFLVTAFSSSSLPQQYDSIFRRRNPGLECASVDRSSLFIIPAFSLHITGVQEKKTVSLGQIYLLSNYTWV